MRLTVGQIIVLFAGLVAILQKEGLMDAKGNVPQPMAPEALGKVAVDFEQLLKVNGVVIDGKVDSLIGMIPLVMAAIK